MKDTTNRLLTSMKPLFATVGVALLTAPANAAIVNVSASPTAIIGFFNTTGAGATGADRSGGDGGAGDHLLGNASGGFRNLVVTFDPSSYASIASNPNATLLSATLVMIENSNDTTSGTANIFAYFSNEANRGISASTPNNSNQGATSGTTGFFGNSAARQGAFGGGSGPDNVNPFYTSGVSSIGHTFVTGVDTITLDLKTAGISLANIQTTLANDATSNAGIFLDSTFASQIRLRNNMTLNLSFDVVPEPSSTALLGLGALGFILRRRR